MKLNFNQHFKNLLQQSPTLRVLLNRTTQINQLNQALSAYLDPDLAKHCKVANLNQGRLILATSSPAWNHRLRFLKSDLLSALRQQPEWCGLITIESFVQQYESEEHSAHNTTLNQQASIKPRLLPTNAGSLLMSAANQISSSALASALLKLARHAQPD